MSVPLLVAIPTLLTALLLCGLGAALYLHPYAGRLAMRYLRSKKRGTVSVITGISVSGVALGVTALLTVMSVTSGFQDEFRNKVLGVNAHVLVLKYGLDFEEYREVVDRAREMPEVSGAAPFLINEMMLAKEDRISGVLVKGVDPELMLDVLDLPNQLTLGSLRGLRAHGAAPPVRPEDLLDEYDDDDWAWLDPLADGAGRTGEETPETETPDTETPEAETGPDLSNLDPDDGRIELPDVDVASVDEAEAALAAGEEMPELPPDDLIFQFLDEENLALEEEDPGRRPLEELPGIVVGSTLAANLGIGIGDRVTVISPLAGLDTSLLGRDEPAPRSREFRVIGIFSAGFQEYDTRLVYVDLYEAQHFFQHGDSVTGVEIALHDLDAAPTVSRRLERVLGGGPYHTMDWQELNHNLFTALQIQKIVLSFVIATIIMVAAVLVIVTLIMIVLEKKREIAILKAMGARGFGILLTFMVQGLLIGLAGTLLGLLAGGAVCLYLERLRFPLDPHVYLIDHLPVRTSPVEFATTAAVALFICMCATVIPSWWAARLLPADGIRYE